MKDKRTRWPVLSSSIGCVSRSIAALRTNATARAASTWRWPQSCCGTRSTWSAAPAFCTNNGRALVDKLRQRLSPLGWEHINLAGDYI